MSTRNGPSEIGSAAAASSRRARGLGLPASAGVRWVCLRYLSYLGSDIVDLWRGARMPVRRLFVGIRRPEQGLLGKGAGAELQTDGQSV